MFLTILAIGARSVAARQQTPDSLSLRNLAVPIACVEACTVRRKMIQVWTIPFLFLLLS